MTKEIVGQILSFIAMAITFSSYQVNTKSKLLITQTLATVFTCASYLFLNAMSGFVLNIVCIVRNIAFYFQNEKSKFNYVSACIFAVAMAFLGVLSWQGYISLLIIVALAINTIFLSLGKPQLLRKSILLTSSLILFYNIFVFSLGGILNETIAIVSSIVGIIRFHKENNKQQQVIELAHQKN